MNPGNKTDLSQKQTTNLEEQTFEKEFRSQKGKRQIIDKIKIQIKFTSNQKFIYSQNGAVLRIVERLDILKKSEIFNNMDQIRNLSWQGQYDQNKKRDGKWIPFWDRSLLKNVGGYYKEGQKLGLWNDLFLNYSSEVQIYEVGEYCNGYKIGKWNYLIRENQNNIYSFIIKFNLIIVQSQISRNQNLHIDLLKCNLSIENEITINPQKSYANESS